MRERERESCWCQYLLSYRPYSPGRPLLAHGGLQLMAVSPSLLTAQDMRSAVITRTSMFVNKSSVTFKQIFFGILYLDYWTDTKFYS